MKSPKKVLVIGLDAPIPPRVYMYAQNGQLPNIGHLIASGVFAENCMVPFPSITPPNWTTIVTGAWQGTHGITCFNLHNPGDPLDKTYQAFSSLDCRAEYMWNAAERAGKKSILINYPTTWPSTLKDGIQLGGAGLGLNEWQIGLAPWAAPCTLCSEQLFATEEYPRASVMELEAAQDWANVETADALSAELKLQYPQAKIPVKPKSYYLLLEKTDAGYGKASICRSRDAKDAFATISPGEWTGVLEDQFDTAEGKSDASFKCKLVQLSEDAEEVRLYFSAICALEGWSYPESIAREIKSETGLPLPRSGFQALNMEWIDPDTFVEIVDLQHAFYADAAAYLFGKYDWDLYFMHAHCPDFAHHAFSNKMDPLTAASEEEWRTYQNVELGFYLSIDRMVGKIVHAAGDDALVIMVSDHGAKATTNPFNPGKVLADAGLTVYKEGTGPGPRQVDWSKTKAVVSRSCYVYVNLKGRDPDGIVEPGAEYEEVREQVINALYDYTDPKTGKKPIIFALRLEDARVLSLYGDTCGDIVYAISEFYGGQHGPHLPTARYGIGDVGGLFIMSGPGVKKNVVLKRNVWLPDVVPTICYLTGLPVPRDAEGAVIYQALESC